VANDVVRPIPHDAVGANLTLVAGSNVVVQTTNGSVATANPFYDGITDTNLLAAGGKLTSLGRIRVTVDMIINLGTPDGTVLRNQTFANGALVKGATASDNIDATTTNVFNGPNNEIDPNSVPQTQRSAFLDPTTVRIANPTAANASIEGSVRDANRKGIGRALIIVLNAATSETRSVITNTFGYYRIDDLQSGSLYSVSVSHKRYRFANPTVTFSLNDNVAGLTFVADAPAGSMKTGAVNSSGISGRSAKRKF